MRSSSSLSRSESFLPLISDVEVTSTLRPYLWHFSSTISDPRILVASDSSGRPTMSSTPTAATRCRTTSNQRFVEHGLMRSPLESRFERSHFRDSVGPFLGPPTAPSPDNDAYRALRWSPSRQAVSSPTRWPWVPEAAALRAIDRPETAMASLLLTQRHQDEVDDRYSSYVDPMPSARPICGSQPRAEIREISRSLRGVPSGLAASHSTSPE